MPPGLGRAVSATAPHPRYGKAMTSDADTSKAWNRELAGTAIKTLGQFERTLLGRLADARGQRVPVSELSAAFGLPAAPSLAQDFPALTGFCIGKCDARAEGDERPEMPVAQCGDNDKAWYWMSPADANAFRGAFKDQQAQEEQEEEQQPSQ
jgi:hypothetical protein